MDLSSLLQDLQLGPASVDVPHPSRPLPSITELLSELRAKLIDLEHGSLIGGVEQLFRVADPDWLFSPVGEAGGWEELRLAYHSVVCALIDCADLSLCDEGEDLLNKRDVPFRAAAVSSALTALLESLERLDGQEGVGLLLALAPPICVLAVTHVQEESWTTPTSRAAARRLQKTLLRTGHWRDSAHLLTGDGILEGVLDILQPQLSRDAIERRPAATPLFVWTLLQVKRPFLSPLLPRLLPPSLLLNDHYRPEKCMLGVQCLHHIVLNTPAADLLHFNRAELIYQALFKHLYSTEAAVIQLVLSCLLDLLLVLEKPPSCPAPSSSRRSCRHDDVLRLFLTHMEGEQRVALRHVYSGALPLYIDRMGMAMCRHLRRLERVVLGYLEVRDSPEETSRLNILEALQRTSRVAWPRIRPRVGVLLRSLLRLLVDVSSDSQLDESVRQMVTNQTLHCMRLLDDCSQGDVQRLLHDVDSSCCSDQLLSYLATVTAATET
ncbi:unnamed protein product [Ophioblennius macclurei]